ncbi:hypothetical protein K501DRAFT_265210 [Backusella circina FSU 941]|nr:hypothetical protein K501DRAFT_265210 [Backusella circina FSU 941]
MALPEMNASLKAGFDMIQTVSDFFAVGNAHFNFSGSSNPTLPISQATTSSFSMSPYTSGTLLSPSMPIYSLNRNRVTVIDVWREYDVGPTGCPAVKDLERNYGTKWTRIKVI